MRDLPQGELTFVFTDVEGSTRLLAALGSRYVAVHRDHQAIVRAAVARHAGVEVSTEGDGFFLVFPQAVDAALAAAEILSSVESRDWPADGRVRIRIGIHSGRAVLAADDYVGIDVNRAARIAAAANGGQILISDAAATLVGDATAGVASIRDLGRHRLKDIGVEQLYRLEPVGVSPDERPLRTLEAAPSNLPAVTRALVDRETEREQLSVLIDEHRLVTLTGAGGIGKTALALDIANAIRGRFVDGVGYVDLAAVDNVETAAAMLVEGLGLASDADLAAAATLARQLRSRDVLLVIETAEHLPAIRDLLAALVRDCSRLRVLVTSRAALHLQAERELRLDPLSDASAYELFVARARAVRPTWEPTNEEVAAISLIARRLDGLPLAIELAAARTRVLTVAQILERLEKRLPVLTGGAVDAPTRQRTLHATVEWSYQQLSEPERTLLQTLAAFASEFDLEAVEDMVARVARDIEPAVVLDHLDGLVDQSLVDLRQADASRFRLLGAIREFALEELTAGGYLDLTQSAHFAWMLDVARASADVVDSAARSGDQVGLRAYEDDLRAALAWALETPLRARDALKLAALAGPFWYALGRAREGSTWLERAIAATPEARAATDGDAHYWAGVLADERRQPAQAIEHLELSLEIRRELGDDFGIARALNSLGVVSRTAGNLERARELLTESLERKRVTNDPRLGSTITNLAIVAVDEGRLDEALRLFEEALDADRRAGSPEPHPAVLLGIALVHARLGQPERAIEPVLEAARRFLALDDQLAVAECLEVLVEAWRETGPGSALVLLRAADLIRATEGIPRNGPEVDRLLAIDEEIRAGLSHQIVESLEAEGRALDAPGAVAYAEAVALNP